MNAVEIIQNLVENNKVFFTANDFSNMFDMEKENSKDIITSGINNGVFHEIGNEKYCIDVVFQHMNKNQKEYELNPIYDEKIKYFREFLQKFFNNQKDENREKKRI